VLYTDLRTYNHKDVDVWPPICVLKNLIGGVGCFNFSRVFKSF